MKAILFAGVLMTLVVILVPPIFPWYGSLPDNSKNFVSAFGAAIIGTIIFFLKKRLDKRIRFLEQTSNPTDSKKKRENYQIRKN